MTTEHSQSQNQAPETTISTSDKRYQNSLANAVHTSQQAFGLEKYGVTLDQVPDDKYDWQLMALEESVDMNQYLTRELRRIKELYRILFNTHEETFQELIDVKEELIEQIELTKTYARMLPNGLGTGEPDDSNGVFSVRQSKEMMEDGISD